jgi:predicted Zn-dependent protease
MPRKSSKESEFEEMRDAGIGLAAKLVIENKLDQAKDVFTKLLNLRPDDVEVMTLHANIYFFEGKLLEAENRLN